jgi:hypothetical protein
VADKITSTQVAAAIPFDNSVTGFVSTNLQDVIDEIGFGSSVNIPEHTSDPVSPAVNSAWVIKITEVAGTPIGLLLALTESITGDFYYLSYKTIAGDVIRTELKGW